jgi:hypothetical protein
MRSAPSWRPGHRMPAPSRLRQSCERGRRRLSDSTTSWKRCEHSINKRTAAAIGARSVCVPVGERRTTTKAIKAGHFSRYSAMTACNRYVVGREHNVVHVDFGRKPDPPAPEFPGAAALRSTARYSRPLGVFAGSVRNGSQPRESNTWATSS